MTLLLTRGPECNESLGNVMELYKKEITPLFATVASKI